MTLKNYQKEIMADLSHYLDLLKETNDLNEAFSCFWQEKGVVVGIGKIPPYQNILPGVPCICDKVPTGGGKTFVACNAIKPIFDAIPVRKAKVVVWLVPSEAILTQTLAALRDTDHPYRQKLDVDFGSSVEIYSKQQLLTGQNFNPTSVNELLSICVLSYDSFRGEKENLKARQENSNLAEFAKILGTPENPLPDADNTALMQILNQLSPLVIVDESHHAKSNLSMKMLRDFNPCFVLELTATPKKESNIISYVDAYKLKKENMVKLPVIVYNRSSKEQVLLDTIDLRDKLEKIAIADRETTSRYIRPIALFQAQPKGKEDSTTFEKLRDKLVEIGIPAEYIAIRTADVNELKSINLMSEDCPIRYIITVNALKEGWDCPFAYVLASLANKTSKVDVEQILGRVLRLPHTKKNKTPSLNMSYVLTSSNDFSATLDNIVKGLNSAGFSGKDYRIGVGSSSLGVEASKPTPSPTPSPALGSTSPDSEAEAPAEEFLDFDPTAISAQLSQQKDSEQDGSEVPSNVDDMLRDAEKTGLDYEDAIKDSENPSLSDLPFDVRESVPVYHIKPEFVDEIENLSIPQFILVTPKSIFSEATATVLDKEALAKGFTLKGKPSDIDFDSADAEIVQIDVRGNTDALPRVFKMTASDQQLFKDYFSHMPAKNQVDRCKQILFSQVNSFNEIPVGELQPYVDRIVSEMTPDQLSGLEQSPYAYGKKVKDKIQSLLEAYYEEQFGHLMETGKIACDPIFKLPEIISPAESTSMYGGTLYEAEEAMDGLEMELALELTSFTNIRWWHRNNKYEFRINGFINHYPDFIIMMESGILLLVETKGQHLKNDESYQKVRLGRAWEKLAGPKYRYYMVFRDIDTRIEGAKSMSEFLKILKDL